MRQQLLPFLAVAGNTALPLLLCFAAVVNHIARRRATPLGRGFFAEDEPALCDLCRSNPGCPSKQLGPLLRLRAVWWWAFLLPCGASCMGSLALLCGALPPLDIRSNVDHWQGLWAVHAICAWGCGLAVQGILNTELARTGSGVSSAVARPFFSYFPPCLLLSEAALLLLVPAVPVGLWIAVVALLALYVHRCAAGQPADDNGGGLSGGLTAGLLLSSRKERRRCGCRCCNGGRFTLRREPFRPSFSNTFAFALFAPVVELGSTRSLEQRDLKPLPAALRLDLAESELWDVRRRRPSESLLRTLLRFTRGPMARATAALVVFECLSAAQPLVMRELVRIVERSEVDVGAGVALALALWLLCACSGCLLQHYEFAIQREGLRVHGALSAAIYRQSLRAADATSEFLSLVATDVENVQNCWQMGCLIVTCPLQLVLSIGLLYFQLGSAVSAGVVATVALALYSAGLSVLQRRFERELLQLRDQRLQATRETLAQIKGVKMHAWEDRFERRIGDIRRAELRSLRRYQILDALQDLQWTVSNVFVSTASLVCYVLQGHALTASTAFAAIAQFEKLQFPLSVLPAVVAAMNTGSVACRRIEQKGLSRPLVPRRRSGSNPGEVTASHLTAAGAGGAAVLDDVSFRAPPGSLTMIAGKSGAGKSALLLALLGELSVLPRTLDNKWPSTAATISSPRVAFASQAAWLHDATVRENILFGLPYVASWYTEVLTSCCLAADLDQLPGRDLYQVRGHNLSGGQRQRVALARAVYSCGRFGGRPPTSVVLLDDSLSAADSRVAAHVFEQCLRDLLLRRLGCTVLFATHRVELLEFADQVLFFERRATVGVCTAVGPHERLLQDSPAYANFTAAAQRLQSPPTPPPGLDASPLLVPDDESAADSSDEDERVAAGGRREALTALIRDAGPAAFLLFIALLAIAAQALVAAQPVWLSYWTDNQADIPTAWGVAIFAATGVLGSLATCVLYLCIARAGRSVGRRVHSRLLHRVLAAPLSFFLNTPLGRLLNRFTEDIAVVDEGLLSNLENALCNSLQIVSMGLVVLGVLPVFALFYPLLVVFLVQVQVPFLHGKRQLERLQKSARAPVFSLFSQTLEGAATIRAFNRGERFMQQQLRNLAAHYRAMYPAYGIERWMCFRTQQVAAAYTGLTALFVVARTCRGTLPPARAAMAITCTTTAELINWLLYNISSLQADVVSLERVLDYALHAPQESSVRVEPELTPPAKPSAKPAAKPTAKPTAAAVVLAAALSPAWPQQGTIGFRHVSLSYESPGRLAGRGLSPAAGLPPGQAAPALRNVSFEVGAGEKVGIVGRTGAGKSSILAALLRLVDPSKGVVLIDGLDIARVPLNLLRSRIATIPQDPAFFSGTLRFNLDPLGAHSDEELWAALEGAHMADCVRDTFKGQLAAQISENARDFSAGQKQMLCLARALLAKSRVLLLDEATSSVDVHTERVIQATLRTQFERCTILTIAHRIETVLGYDRVLVMEQGELVEHGPPGELLALKDSLFRELCSCAGLI